MLLLATTLLDLTLLKCLSTALANDGGIVEDMYAISRGAIKRSIVLFKFSASDYLRAEQAVFVDLSTTTATVGDYS